MKFDPKKLNALAVRLHGQLIGVINRLAGNRQIFAFEQDYIDNPQRPTLSLSFKGRSGGLVTGAAPRAATACRCFRTCFRKRIFASQQRRFQSCTIFAACESSGFSTRKSSFPTCHGAAKF